MAQARDLWSMHAPMFGLHDCFNFFGLGSSYKIWKGKIERPELPNFYHNFCNFTSFWCVKISAVNGLGSFGFVKMSVFVNAVVITQ